jgi:hypothetical protein
VNTGRRLLSPGCGFLFPFSFFFFPSSTAQSVDYEALPFSPERAVVYRAVVPLTIDGRADEPAWQATPWSKPFVDIEGDRRPAPRLTTRMKMLWDDEHLYIAADMEEPDVWATLKARDSVIFHDNDFEVFIDPDGDTHAYYELEVNALGTEWDLMLVQPYRDGGPPIDAWDIAGLRTGVDVRGTINRPGDRDRGWSVELALPWRVLREAARDRRAPKPGEQWRLNFSRVEWDVDVKDGRYVKRLDAAGKALREHNWVWSPQGAIDMHMPERWGFVQFSGLAAGATEPFVENRNERVKWALRRLYLRQRQYRSVHKRYATDLAALNAGNIVVDGLKFTPVLESTGALYEIRAPGFDGLTIHIRQDGRTWATASGPRPQAPGPRPKAQGPSSSDHPHHSEGLLGPWAWGLGPTSRTPRRRRWP